MNIEKLKELILSPEIDDNRLALEILKKEEDPEETFQKALQNETESIRNTTIYIYFYVGIIRKDEPMNRDESLWTFSFDVQILGLKDRI